MSDCTHWRLLKRGSRNDLGCCILNNNFLMKNFLSLVVIPIIRRWWRLGFSLSVLLFLVILIVSFKKSNDITTNLPHKSELTGLGLSTLIKREKKKYFCTLNLLKAWCNQSVPHWFSHNVLKVAFGHVNRKDYRAGERTKTSFGIAFYQWMGLVIK